MNIFNNLPLNTKKVYVMGIDHSGCEIYIPVNSLNEEIILSKKYELKQFLFNQPLPGKHNA